MVQLVTPLREASDAGGRVTVARPAVTWHAVDMPIGKRKSIDESDIA